MDLVRNDLVSSKEVSRLLAFVENERRYFQEIFALLPVVLAVVSADHKILSVNRAFRKHLGAPSYSPQRSDLSDFLPGEDLKRRLDDVFLSGKGQENVSLCLPGSPARCFRLAILPLPESENQGRSNVLIVLEDLLSEPQLHPAENPTETPAAGEPETVLIVASDVGVRALMGKALTRQGYFVLEASDAEAAVRLSMDRIAPIHLAVSDAGARSVNGSDVIERLRRDRPELRALYVGSGDDDSGPDSGAGRSNTSYLSQPFTLNSFLDMVRTLLDAA